MKLYLFGGAEIEKGEAPVLKQLINGVLAEMRLPAESCRGIFSSDSLLRVCSSSLQSNEVFAGSRIKPRQLLQIPYARINVPHGEEWTWGEGWVKKELRLGGTELLDTRDENDLTRAEKPVIFMNGGPDIDVLYEKITSDERLYNLVMNADYVIGESSGAMVTAEYRLTYQTDPPTTMWGLGILKDTIIEAHYTQRKRQQALRNEMKECGARYGIGIDSITGIIADTQTYPEKYEAIGDGLVEMVKLDSLD